MHYMWKYALFTVFGLIQMKLAVGRKNVLFIVSDDLRPQLASYYGPNFPSPVHPMMHTPNTDALAARSLLLTRAYVQQAICSPSRTSFLTGRRPDTTHVYDLKHYFRKVGGNFTTIPQYFKQNGYLSVGIGKIFHPGHSASNHDDPVSWSVPYFHGNTTFENKIDSWQAIPDQWLDKTPLLDQQLANHAIETLQKLAPAALSGDKQFFVAVGFHKPHLPFVFPESMMKYYPESSIRLPDNAHAPVNMPKIAWHHFGDLLLYKDISVSNATGKLNTTFPEGIVKKLRRAYYSAVTYVDSLVGRVVSELDRLGLANNTIISFIGDHGWQLGEHAEWCKETNFELATQAPMMISIPGETDKGIQTNQLAEFVDIFPTLVDAAELPPLDLCPEDSKKVKLCREGTSLLPLIRNPHVPVKNATFSQFPRKLHSRNVIMGYTMRTDRYRYTEWVDFSFKTYLPKWHKVHGIELYDHQIDPEENENRAADSAYSSIAGELSKSLHAGWRHTLV